jgi:type I restriction enzyme S subunit
MARDGWREVLLEDGARDVTVGHVGPMASEYVSDGIPFLRSQNVEPLRVNDADLKFIAPSFHERLRKSALSPGDVVIVRTGRPGACAVIPTSFPVANCSDLVIIRCGPDLDPRYLAYYVNSVAAHHVDSHLVGAVQQHFNVGSARKMVLYLPSVQEQRAVVHILGTLDDRIELNRRMSETLEAVTRTLFKSWFVDFDPVRAKAQCRDPGVPKALADLFPDSFEASGLGQIPKGWGTGSILMQARLLSGGTPKTDRSDYWDGGVAWASAKDVSQSGQAFLVATERTITNKGLEESATQLVPALCTVIVARGATTGRMVMLGGDMAMNQTCYALDSSTGTPFALYCRLREAVDKLVHAAHGSVFDTITTSTFSSSRVVLAPRQPLEAFERLVSAGFQRILAGIEECVSLATLRETLLPKLISGEVRLKDAERIVGSAT